MSFRSLTQNFLFRRDQWSGASGFGRLLAAEFPQEFVRHSVRWIEDDFATPWRDLARGAGMFSVGREDQLRFRQFLRAKATRFANIVCGDFEFGNLSARSSAVTPNCSAMASCNSKEAKER